MRRILPSRLLMTAGKSPSRNCEVKLYIWISGLPGVVRGLALPKLSILRSEYADQGVEVIAIDVDENREDGRLFLKRYPVTYPVLSDPDGKINGTMKTAVA